MRLALEVLGLRALCGDLGLGVLELLLADVELGEPAVDLGQAALLVGQLEHTGVALGDPRLGLGPALLELLLGGLCARHGALGGMAAAVDVTQLALALLEICDGLPDLAVAGVQLGQAGLDVLELLLAVGERGDPLLGLGNLAVGVGVHRGDLGLGRLDHL